MPPDGRKLVSIDYSIYFDNKASRIEKCGKLLCKQQDLVKKPLYWQSKVLG